MTEFRHAGSQDRTALIDLLLESGMEHAEPISDYLLALVDGKVVGCIRTETIDQMVLIRPVVVAINFRKRGVGRLLVEKILTIHEIVAVASRGEAVPFYSTLGFTTTQWDMMPATQSEECRSCPDRQTCCPQPLIRGQQTIADN